MAFEVTLTNHIVVYVDGSFKPSPYGEPYAQAGVGAFFRENHPMNISKIIDAAGLTSTDVEIRAVTEALKALKATYRMRVEVRSDAKTVMEIASIGAPQHKSQAVYQQLLDVANGMDIKFAHVPRGTPGVIEAHKLARRAINGQ